MSLISGASAVSAAVGALGSIASALFPNQITIKIPVEGQQDPIEVNIDAATNIGVNTTVSISEHPSENKKVFIQNIAVNPRRITLRCVLSNVIRLSNIKTLGAAAQFGVAAALPELGSLTNILLNEEDSIVTRLEQLRVAQETGKIVEVIGLEEQTGFQFVIESIDDNESTQTGTKSREVDITLREAFIVTDTSGEKAIFGKEVEVKDLPLISVPAGVSSITGGIS